MSKRKTISFHIKRKIAEHFVQNGFDKQTRKSAEKIYDELSRRIDGRLSEKPIAR